MQTLAGQRVAAPVRQAERMAVASTSRPSSARPIVINAAAFGVKKTANQLLRELARGTSARKTTSRSAVTGATGATCALDIVFVAAEVAPWSKTGGLGDVTGGLPIELVKRGHRVMTIAPRYDQYADAWDTSVVVDIMGEKVRFFHSIKKGVHRVWVDHPWFLAKVWGKTGSKLYGPRSGADYLDNHKRFALFCKAAIEAARVLPFGPGEDCIFVANDWHSSLVPVLLKDEYQPKGQFTKAKSVLAIHNIAFQGRMWEEAFKDMKLPQAAFEKLAFSDGYAKVYTEATPMEEDEKPPLTGKTYKKINWLKGGIIAADKLVTVSPNYATEIAADAAGGVELDTVIRAKGIEGIVNGMDIEEWNPKTDKYLTVPYDQNSVYAGKAAAKEALQAELGLPVDPTAPLFAFIGRLEEQKGVDIILAALPKILATPKVQIAILGTGKAAYEKLVNAIGTKYKGRAKGVVKFSAPLAHMLTAGADFMLVPSRFEPCGLIQLHAMHYGTVPVVASTGGLVDTVKEGVTGFHMGALNPDKLDEADADALAATVRRASEVFAGGRYKEMVYNCISQDLSWSKPAQKWEGLLEEVVYGKGGVATAKKEEIKVPVAEKIPGDLPAVSYAPNTLKPVSASTSSNGASAPKTGTTAPPMGSWRATTPSGPTPAAATPKVTTYKPALPATAKPKAAGTKLAGEASSENGAAASNGNGASATKTSAAKPLVSATTGKSA
ncbi:hypothetical protein HYH02_005327 [Chlamydomonas schloesseri]|uniref:Starch synthase, chloroplastic/amyloplastic n=1 Tax=Chlamydomonas schloesseri TaxID=2026947 RepID=A0A835WL96_9CHLO|nr:hypothetical protein HYH02_005327 [Chlamydomonas schloesseri]|eukprot:KAG2449804.1 hypothetical protein HYH02_005327 [Chlamydomonas schloesseri]